jgi:predicted metal-binding membrane protein
MTRQRTDRGQLVCLVIAGYLLIWMLFGIVAVLGDGVLHTVLERNAWLETHAWLIGAIIFGMAGIYQFTPLKYYCLDKCRAPMGFLMLHWQGRRDRTYVAAWSASRPLLPRLLLVPDAADVHGWDGQSGLDAAPRCGDGG